MPWQTYSCRAHWGSASVSKHSTQSHAANCCFSERLMWIIRSDDHQYSVKTAMIQVGKYEFKSYGYLLVLYRSAYILNIHMYADYMYPMFFKCFV